MLVTPPGTMYVVPPPKLLWLRLAPAMMPVYVTVAPSAIWMPPEFTRMPRLELSVSDAVIRRLPPSKTRWPAVGELGGVPSPASAEMAM